MLDVSVKHLSFSYDKDVILDDINMKVKSGAFICLLGQSGCGKSTFLRLLAGLEKPSTGEILVNNEPVKKAGLQRGVVFQDYGLFPWMTAGENIMIALKQKFKKMNAKQRKDEAIKRIKDVELDEAVFDKLPKELSGGMKQRCAIARAFSIDPPILLMDEPFGALDAVTRAKLQDLVLELWKKETENRKTIFFVTHDVDEALLLATDIFVFGQSPSKIIYSYSFKKEKNLDRKTMHDDLQVMELRNQLIKIIHNEVQMKVNI
ncbi:ABC-type nitrate/sulfonate/bicarbonate transport system, ATpase component [Clostridium aceticum]|uniref:ABC-type nitrate/sulfonate/bicarbonate transport system, ATpase component n=1 Tax=Clostridium aceticum TaxID=84022 RepID=A0A0D8I9L8_9CLOT|nr:ABC transporter ATP-binding protein [Clostridium aceticum]AKL95691.1 ABC-type nitrate/sulfonate/bicarbonate transport system, ATpase component [Clostridium aceticum]KJF26754.1 sulfonate ABC transporter ATP-binding protein [Clostridium aceticum]